MGKAEVGSAKYIANKMKAKGLQRLRWYCQVCEKQMRDENGFKCHTQSESHLKRVLQVGKHGNPSIETYSKQFKTDFLYLLRTSHGEKPIGANRFYNEYIQNRDHVHMNATKWNSLAAFVTSVQREGLIKVSGDESGQTIAWIDTSEDARAIRDELAREQKKAAQEDSSRALRERIRRAKEQNELLEKQKLESAEQTDSSKPSDTKTGSTPSTSGPTAGESAESQETATKPKERKPISFSLNF